MDFVALAHHCAPNVHIQTMTAIVKTESSFNPFAIGVVKGSLTRQPRNLSEAVETAKELERRGFNYSVGLAQVNKHNFKGYGITLEQAFDPCTSLNVGAKILEDCYHRATRKGFSSTKAVHAALSCYYSNNFITGFKPDFKGQPSYVNKVINNAIGINPNTAKVVIPRPSNSPTKIVKEKPKAVGGDVPTHAKSDSSMVF